MPQASHWRAHKRCTTPAGRRAQARPPRPCPAHSPGSGAPQAAMCAARAGMLRWGAWQRWHLRSCFNRASFSASEYSRRPVGLAASWASTQAVSRKKPSAVKEFLCVLRERRGHPDWASGERQGGSPGKHAAAPGAQGAPAGSPVLLALHGRRVKVLQGRRGRGGAARCSELPAHAVRCVVRATGMQQPGRALPGSRLACTGSPPLPRSARLADRVHVQLRQRGRRVEAVAEAQGGVAPPRRRRLLQRHRLVVVWRGEWTTDEGRARSRGGS